MKCMNIKLIKKTKGTFPVFKIALALFSSLLLIPAYITAQESKPADQAKQPAISGAAGIVIEEGVPGGMVAETFEVSAKVTVIDKENRIVTLEDAGGSESVIMVGAEAANFDQIEVGDMVVATVTRELIVQLLGEEDAAIDGTQSVVAMAGKGSQPAGAVGSLVQLTATVSAIDQDNRTATLTLEDGTSKTIPVRDDIDLTERKVGEKVVFLVTEMVALSIEKP